MSTELGGVESGSDVSCGGNASRFENGVAEKSETLADNDLLEKKLELNGCLSVGDDEIESRNDVSESGFGTETNDVETEAENDSDVDSCEKRNRKGSRRKQESNLDVVDSAIENLKLPGSDLVWAKVRSYPWWPGQVFDSSIASKKAKKHFKKGKFLVAFFGDCSFAWNDASMIKPFHQHFSEMVKQSNSEDFLDAIDSALEEVSKRVEFGLYCACVSEEACERLKAQNIANAGIQEASHVRYGGDKLSNAKCFEPKKLAEYVKRLTCFPLDGETDKLEIVSKRAQLSAFQLWKSDLNFPKYETFIRSVESIASLPDEEMSSKKRKTSIKDKGEHERNFGFEDKTKEKASSDKKRKVESLETGEADKKVKNNREKEDLASKNSDQDVHLSAEPHFVGSEMNSLTPLPNSRGDSSSVSKVEVKNKKTKKPKLEELAEKKISSPDEMLPNSAKPQDESNYEELDKFLKEITWNNLDAKESVIQISEQQMLPVDQEGVTGSDSNEQTGTKECSADSSSKEELKSIFNRYGCLIESETQVMKKTKRAKVVFKRGEDAKSAFSSTGKLSIFGPSLLSYGLKNVPPSAKQGNNKSY